jgi:hypothetical protein
MKAVYDVLQQAKPATGDSIETMSKKKGNLSGLSSLMGSQYETSMLAFPSDISLLHPGLQCFTLFFR